METIEKCIVVGAGISGLLAAQKLRDYDIKVTVLEKSQGFGGRMATKKMGGAIFDHGAQFMTTREQLFRERVEDWMKKGEVLPWYKGPLGNMRYVGKNGMTTVPDRLGKELSVRLSEKVTGLHFDKDKWTVETTPHNAKKTRSYKADFLILSPPVPQAIELIGNSNIELDYDEEEELRRIQYIRCISVMAILNGPAGLPNPGAVDLNHDILRWIGSNSAKGVSPGEGIISILTSPKFAEAYWDTDPDECAEIVLTAAKPFLKSDVVEHSSHRWRYSDPIRVYKEKQPFRKPYFLDESIRLGMCGDGFNGPRIEAAAMSGIQLADAIVRPV